MTKLSFLEESITKRSEETRQIMETQKILNQTTKKDPNVRGQSVDKSAQELLFPVWQPLVDELRTFSFTLNL